MRWSIKTTVSALLIFAMAVQFVMPVQSAFAANQTARTGGITVDETASEIAIGSDNYRISIAKSGFRYAFYKADGTLAVPAHAESGIRFSSPDSSTLYDVRSTELISYTEDEVHMKVTNTNGNDAEAVVKLYPNYANFRLIPTDDGLVRYRSVMKSDVIGGEGLIISKQSGFSDFEYEITMNQHNEVSGSSASGVVFRYVDYDNFYLLRLAIGSKKMQLLKKANGAYTTIGEQALSSIGSNIDYKLKVKVIDNTITGYVDGVQTLTYTDSQNPFLTGKIGLRTYKDVAEYSDPLVTDTAGRTLLAGFGAVDMSDWSDDVGTWTLASTMIPPNYMIDFRTSSLNPGYGLGDYAIHQSNSNVFGYSTNNMINKGGESRFISTFTIFPAHDFAQVLFEDGSKRVAVTASENRLGANNVKSVEKLYYFMGSTEQIYKDYKTVRNAEGYLDYKPKYDFFEVGYEAFGSLGWNTYQTSVMEDLQTYLDKGYRLKWGVVGSGFWKGDRNANDQGATESFGIWDDTPDAPRTDGLPNPRYPDVQGLKDFFHDNDMNLILGLRVNFKAPVSEGGYYNAAYDGTFPIEGVQKGYFVNTNGQPNKYTVNFPKGKVYILDTSNPDALDWYINGVNLWGVDGFKEDTMLSSDLNNDGLWNKSDGRLMDAGYMTMVRNAAYSVPGDILRLEDTQHGFDQDRPVINAINYAASGAPNVYSDIVAGKYLTLPLSENVKKYFVRNATWAALTPAMSVGFGPWKMDNAEYEGHVKKSVDFHSEYAPYIYSAAIDSYETGFPYTMTPLPIAYPHDSSTYNLANTTTRQYEWMLGQSMLAYPAYGNDYASVSSRNVYLPEGKWIDYETGDVHTGPKVLNNYAIPMGKIPVFIGGKGVTVKRDLNTEQLKAEVYPIAKDGSEYRYTYPDGTSHSTIANNNIDWNKDTLVVRDRTTGSAIPYSYNGMTGSLTFDIQAGHDYELLGGEYTDEMVEVSLSLPEGSELAVGGSAKLSVLAKLASGQSADLTGADIRYESSDDGIVSVNAEGYATGHRIGEAKLKATVQRGTQTLETNELSVRVVPLGLAITEPAESTFTSQPIVVRGTSSGIANIELRANGLVLPANKDADGSWSAILSGLPNGWHGIQAIGRDASGQVLALDKRKIEVQIEEAALLGEFDDATGWTVTSGSWQAAQADGRSVYKNTGNGIAYSGSTDWHDYRLETVIKMGGDAAGGGASGVIFRFQNAQNFYHFRFDDNKTSSTSVKTAQMYKWVNGTATKIGELPFEFNYADWYTLAVEVQGNVIKGYINGELAIGLTDDSIASGAVGFRANGRNIFVDRIVVGPIPTEHSPSWLAGSLTATEIAADSVTVSWIGAEHREDDRIEQYTLWLNDSPVRSVPSDATTYTFEGLTPNKKYFLKVEADSESGVSSTDGPGLVVTTLADNGGPVDPVDTEAPIWSSGSELTASSIGTNQLVLSWTPATDNVGVSAYRITWGASESKTVDGSATTAAITGLTGGTRYEFTIHAVDAAGNWSLAGPSAIATTIEAGCGSCGNGGGVNPSGPDPVDGKPKPSVVQADQALVEQLANRIPMKAPGTSKPAGAAVEVRADSGKSGETLAEPERLILSYSASGADEDLVAVYYYNEANGKWEYVPGAQDRSQKRFTLSADRTGLYSVLVFNRSFSDLADGHWALHAIQALSVRQIVEGTSATSFTPEGQTTRAEFAALLVRALGLTASASSPFDDVAAGAWYASDVAAAHKAGLIQGVSNDRFAPNERITREQMAVMIVRAFEYATGGGIEASGTELSGYADGVKLSPWAQESAAKAIASGLMRGKSAESFSPRTNASRAETAQAIYNMLELLRR